MPDSKQLLSIIEIPNNFKAVKDYIHKANAF